MLLAIVLGVVAGLVGFLPLIVALRATRRVTRTSNFGHMSILLLGLIASSVLLIAFAVICIAFDKSLALPFVLAEAITLSVFAITFGIVRNRDESPLNEADSVKDASSTNEEGR